MKDDLRRRRIAAGCGRPDKISHPPANPQPLTDRGRRSNRQGRWPLTAVALRAAHACRCRRWLLLSMACLAGHARAAVGRCQCRHASRIRRPSHLMVPIAAGRRWLAGSTMAPVILSAHSETISRTGCERASMTSVCRIAFSRARLIGPASPMSMLRVYSYYAKRGLPGRDPWRLPACWELWATRECCTSQAEARPHELSGLAMHA